MRLSLLNNNVLKRDMYGIYVRLISKNSKNNSKFLRASCHSAVHAQVHYSLVQFCGQMLRNTLLVDFTPRNLTGNPVTATLNTTHARSAPTAGQTQEG